MADFSLDALLQPVSEESPAGDNLEYDLAFAELQRIASWTDEKQAGNEVIAAEEPAWRDVRAQSLALLERTRDLQVALYLTQSLGALEGIPGFATGVQLIAQMLDRFWDSVHPMLDADEGNDPVARSSRLAALGDSATTLKIIRAAPLVESRAVGRFSVRDLLVADGLIKPVNAEGAAQRSLLDAALQDLGSEFASTMLESVQAILDGLEAIGTTFQERSEISGTSPDLEDVLAMFKCVRNFYGKGVLASAGGDSAEEATAIAVDAEDNGQSGGALTAAVGTLRTRQDVKRALAQSCEWLRKNEPGHPAPLLIERGSRLLDMDFMEIIRDLAPGGVPEVENIAGLREGAASQE